MKSDLDFVIPVLPSEFMKKPGYKILIFTKFGISLFCKDNEK